MNIRNLILLFFLCPLFLMGQNLTEDQKIRQLIKYISGLDGAVFIRNGDEHAAQEAAEHLEMKWQKAGRRVKTAEDFIEKVASKSFLSGKPYHIKLKSGKQYTSEELLRQELRKIEKR